MRPEIPLGINVLTGLILFSGNDATKRGQMEECLKIECAVCCIKLVDIHDVTSLSLVNS